MARGKSMDYEEMTVDELRDEAKRLGIGGTSHMRKDELIETIRGESQESPRERRGDENRVTGEHREKHLDEDHPGQTLTTQDHDVIRTWAEARGAKPATIAGTQHGKRLGVLRFNFPGFQEGGNLEEVSWDEWFATFDDRKLLFKYQEHLSSGKTSNFFVLDAPDREDG